MRPHSSVAAAGARCATLVLLAALPGSAEPAGHGAPRRWAAATAASLQPGGLRSPTRSGARAACGDLLRINATGNGDESAVFQAAAATGRSLFVPDGVYYAEGIVLKSAGQQLLGNGFAAEIRSVSGQRPIVTLANEGTAVRHLRLAANASGPSMDNNAIQVRSAQLTLYSRLYIVDYNYRCVAAITLRVCACACSARLRPALPRMVLATDGRLKTCRHVAQGVPSRKKVDTSARSKAATGVSQQLCI